MTALEGRLKEAMRAHDEEAPTVSEFMCHQHPLRVPRASFSRAWTAAAVAGILVLVVGLVVLRRSAVSQPASGPLTCPDRVQETTANGSRRASGDPTWVPARPKGVDGSDRLTSADVPDHVTVCAYLQGTGLSGSRAVVSGLDALTATTFWEPPTTHQTACATYRVGTDADSYLLGLTFADGTEWIAASHDHCAGTSNGEFASDANLGSYAAVAYSTGSWPSQDPGPTGAPCYSSGRFGQQNALVPGSPTSLTICPNDGSRPTEFQPAQFRELLTQLAALDTKHGDSSCTPIAPHTAAYTLLFHYASGPALWLSVWAGCTPGINNGDLVANDAAPIAATIATMIADR